MDECVMRKSKLQLAVSQLKGTLGAQVSPKPNIARLRNTGNTGMKRAAAAVQNQFSWHPGHFAQAFEPASFLPLIQFNVGVAFFYTGPRRHAHVSCQKQAQTTIAPPIVRYAAYLSALLHTCKHSAAARPPHFGHSGHAINTTN
jgi:hypothetical protein